MVQILIIDKTGNISYYHSGYDEGDEIKLFNHLMGK